MIKITITSSRKFPDQTELAEILKEKITEIIADGLYIKKINRLSFEIKVKEN